MAEETGCAQREEKAEVFKDVEAWTKGERMLWEPYSCVCVWKQRRESDTEGYCCISSLSSCLAAENRRRRLLSGLLTSTSLSALTVTAALLLPSLPTPPHTQELFSFAPLLLFINPAPISARTCALHTRVLASKRLRVS